MNIVYAIRPALLVLSRKLLNKTPLCLPSPNNSPDNAGLGQIIQITDTHVWPTGRRHKAERLENIYIDWFAGFWAKPITIICANISRIQVNAKHSIFEDYPSLKRPEQ